MNPIPYVESTRIVSPSVDSTCRKSICARLKKIYLIWTLRVGWKSNRHESYESTEVCGHVLRTRKVHVSLFHGSWLPVGYAGWVENVVDSTRFDRIDMHRFSCCRFVMPEVDLRDATPCELSWDVTCDSSRIVKCLRRIDSVWVYVLDMDAPLGDTWMVIMLDYRLWCQGFLAWLISLCCVFSYDSLYLHPR